MHGTGAREVRIRWLEFCGGRGRWGPLLVGVRLLRAPWLSMFCLEESLFGRLDGAIRGKRNEFYFEILAFGGVDFRGPF